MSETRYLPLFFTGGILYFITLLPTGISRSSESSYTTLSRVSLKIFIPTFFTCGLSALLTNFALNKSLSVFETTPHFAYLHFAIFDFLTTKFISDFNVETSAESTLPLAPTGSSLKSAKKSSASGVSGNGNFSDFFSNLKGTQSLVPFLRIVFALI